MFFWTNRGKKSTYRKPGGVKETETLADIIGFTAERLREEYDREWGGFLDVPKLLWPEALAFCQLADLYHKEGHWQEVWEHSLKTMAQSPIFDSDRKGFYRLSSRRDWSDPQPEINLEENVLMLTVILRAYQQTADKFYKELANSMLRKFKEQLFLENEKTWRSFVTGEENRPVIQTRENALMARLLFLAAVILADPVWHDLARETLQAVVEKGYHPKEGVAHYLNENAKKIPPRDVLGDQAALGYALSMAFQCTGEGKWLELARNLMQLSFTREQQDKDPVFPNLVQVKALFARWCVELGALTGEDAFLEKAVGTIHGFLDLYKNISLDVAGLAIAALESREQALVVEIRGEEGDRNLLSLHSAALSFFAPPKVVRLYPSLATDGSKARAVVHMGKSRFGPYLGVNELRKALETAVESRRAQVLFTIKEASRI